MTIPKTSQHGPIPAGSPCFRAAWNGRRERMIPTNVADHRSKTSVIGSIGFMVRRGTAAPVLPGRAAIGVLGAPSRTYGPGLAG